MSQIDPVHGEQESGIDAILTNLPVMLWQRRWMIIIPLVICTIASVITAFVLPRTYRSTATLLVESQDVPNDVAASNANGNIIDQRIAKIRQQIMSRPDLIELIQNNGLYTKERSSQPLSKVIDKMRDAVTIAPVNADIDRSGMGSTIAFTLSYNYPEAAKAQAVAQDFVDRLLKLAASQTEKQATGTVAFLQDQADTLQSQISAIEQQITNIKAQNGAALASGNGLVMSGGLGYDAQIASIQRDNAQLAAQSGGDNGKDPTIVAAQSRLTQLRSTYSENHPDVKLAEQQLAEAKAEAAKNPKSGSPIRDQIAMNNALIQQLNAARASDNVRAQQAARGPVVQEQVAQLENRAEGLRTNYQRVATSLMNARSVAKLQNEQRGERLTVVDPPVVPDEPASPNRPLVIAGGILAGGGIGIALVFLIEMLLRPIRGTAALQKVVGMPPLVVVPVMGDDFEPDRKRFRFWKPKKKRLQEAV